LIEQKDTNKKKKKKIQKVKILLTKQRRFSELLRTFVPFTVSPPKK